MLVDVSHPRGNICWELEALRSSGASLMLLGQRELVQRWLSARGDVDPLVARLRQLVQGASILLYDKPHDLDSTDFMERLNAVVGE